MYKYELHAHTSECDRDAHLGAREPVRLYKEAGYDGTKPFRNQLARQFAAHYGLPVTSGSDTHSPKRLAKGGILTETPIRTPKDLISVLRSGNYQLIENEKTE